MSNSSRRQIRIYEESTWGEDPSTSNKMSDLLATGESLQQQTNTQRSQNLDSSGNTQSVNRVGITAQGALNMEMNYSEGLHTLFEGVMRSSFGSDAGISAETTVAAVATGNKFTDSGAGFGNITVGQWIKVSGFSTAANNGYFRVTAKASSSEITVEGATLVDEAATPAITIKGALLKNGVTDKSYLIEVESADITTFKYFTGMRVGTNQFTFAPNSLVTGSFDFRGKQQFTATATQGDGSPNAAATTKSMNAVDNIQGLWRGSSASSLDVTSFNFNISPQLRDQPALGNLANVGIGSGTTVAQITVEAYFEDRTLIQEYLDGTETAFALVIEDVAGNAYVFDFPQLFPASGEDNTQGIDTDITQRLTYEAFLDQALDGTVGITKIAA